VKRTEGDGRLQLSRSVLTFI